MTSDSLRIPNGFFAIITTPKEMFKCGCGQARMQRGQSEHYLLLKKKQYKQKTTNI